jgi:hypothetical protein
MGMIRNIFYGVLFFTVGGLYSSVDKKGRDPFEFGLVVEYNYSCQAIGKVSAQSQPEKAFALLSIKDKLYTVKAGDKVDQHEIIAILDDGVIVRDNRSVERKVALRKSPST